MDFFLREEVDQSDGQSTTIADCLREEEGAFEPSRGTKGFRWVRVHV